MWMASVIPGLWGCCMRLAQGSRAAPQGMARHFGESFGEERHNTVSSCENGERTLPAPRGEEEMISLSLYAHVSFSIFLCSTEEGQREWLCGHLVIHHDLISTSVY